MIYSNKRTTGGPLIRHKFRSWPHLRGFKISTTFLDIFICYFINFESLKVKKWEKGYFHFSNGNIKYKNINHVCVCVWRRALMGGTTVNGRWRAGRHRTFCCFFPVFVWWPTMEQAFPFHSLGLIKAHFLLWPNKRP